MEDLNAQQKLAVSHIEGPLLVLSGAGSGKTRVITHRIARLLEMGVPSSEILAVTFTNKAAAEMRSRIQSLSRQSVAALTFHSLGARILRDSIHALGYRRDFVIYDEGDSSELLKNCLTNDGAKKDKGTIQSLRAAISKVKNDLLSVEEVVSTLPDKFGFLFARIFSLYQSRLKEYHAVDFDDLLYLPYQLFTSSREILSYYQKRWSFVLIDEYQDTNSLQYALTNFLVARHHNLCVVGDPDQAIYHWRGASAKNLLDFEKDYPNAVVISLEQNYRSTSHILDGANGLIAYNPNRYKKKLWTDLGTGEKIHLFFAQTEKEEAYFVSNQLHTLLEEKGASLDECVIFYRTNAQSRSIEDFLLKLHIPYSIVGGISFYQRKEIKDILAFLRMVISDADFFAFYRTIHLPKRGIGKTSLLKWQKEAQEARLPILLFCRELLANRGPYTITNRQREGIESYLELIDHLRQKERESSSIKEVISTVLERTNYLKLLEEDAETANDRKQNINELLAKGVEWSEEHPEGSLASFLEELSLKTQIDDLPQGSRVQLMTLHSGKGLEFPYVFILGLEEDLLPHLNAKEDPMALEEERRLLYVGMTRAKQFLCLTAAYSRTIWGLPKIMSPSRFLQEIPEEHMKVLNTPLPLASPLGAGEERRDSYLVGTTVLHKDFGEGTVQKVYQTSFGTTYDIYFPSLKLTRSLVAKYARLTPC